MNKCFNQNHDDLKTLAFLYFPLVAKTAGESCEGFWVRLPATPSEDWSSHVKCHNTCSVVGIQVDYDMTLLHHLSDSLVPRRLCFNPYCREDI